MGDAKRRRAVAPTADRWLVELRASERFALINLFLHPKLPKEKGFDRKSLRRNVRRACGIGPENFAIVEVEKVGPRIKLGRYHDDGERFEAAERWPLQLFDLGTEDRATYLIDLLDKLPDDVDGLDDDALYDVEERLRRLRLGEYRAPAGLKRWPDGDAYKAAAAPAAPSEPDADAESGEGDDAP